MRAELAQAVQRFGNLPYYADLDSQGKMEALMKDLDKIGKAVMHGAERNTEIAIRTGGKDLMGSGYSEQGIADAEADYRKPELGGGVLIDYYKELYQNHLKPIMDYSDQRLRETGLLTPEMEAARPQYDWYIPLYGYAELEDVATAQNIEDSYRNKAGGGKKSEILRNKTYSAQGRHGTESASLFETIFTQVEVSVRRAQMQNAKRLLWDYLQTAEGQQAFDAQIETRQINPQQVLQVDMNGQQTWALQAPGGKPYTTQANQIVWQDGNNIHIMTIGNERGLAAIKDFNKAMIDNSLLRAIDTGTRFMASTYTRWNPRFWPINKLNDAIQQMTVMLADAPVGNMTNKSGLAGYAEAAGNVAGRIPLVMRAAKYNVKWTGTAGKTADYQAWLTRYAEQDGVTTHAEFLGREQLLDLERRAWRESVSGYEKAKDIKGNLSVLGEAVDGINNMLELTTRVSAFRALVESGVSEEVAANYVKDIMNFETKGDFARHANAFYPFFTTALYDARRTFKALSKKEGQVVFAALVGFSAMMWGLVAWATGDDEDGVAWIDKYPMGLASRYLIIPIPSDDGVMRGEGIRIPLGFGIGRLANTLAVSTRRLANGTDDAGGFLSNIFTQGVIGNFSPLQPSSVDLSKDPAAWAASTFTPQVLKPIAQFGMNKNWQGNAIYASDTFKGKGDLDYNSGFDWTRDIYKNISETMYDATNGNIDVAPESLEFFARNYLGGTGDFFANIAEIITDQTGLGNKSTASWYKSMPVLGGFIQTTPPEDRTRYYRYHDKVKHEYNKIIDAIKRGKWQDTKENREKAQDIQWWMQHYKQQDRTLRAIREQLKLAREQHSGDALQRYERWGRDMQHRVHVETARIYEDYTGQRRYESKSNAN